MNKPLKKDKIGVGKSGAYMNKKGFTLVELMGVIVILGLILVISIPTIINTLRESEIEEVEIFKQELYMAAESYYLENIHRFDFSVNPTQNVYVNELIDEGYISGTRINPLREQRISYENSYIELTRTHSGVIHYNYVYQD